MSCKLVDELVEVKSGKLYARCMAGHAGYAQVREEAGGWYFYGPTRFVQGRVRTLPAPVQVYHNKQALLAALRQAGPQGA